MNSSLATYWLCRFSVQVIWMLSLVPLAALCLAWLNLVSGKIWLFFDVDLLCSSFTELSVECSLVSTIMFFLKTQWGWTCTESQCFCFILLEETESKNSSSLLLPDCVHVDGIITFWCRFCEEEVYVYAFISLLMCCYVSVKSCLFFILVCRCMTRTLSWVIN